MTRWPALHRLRIGCVQYLNSRPLIHAYDGPVVFEHPAVLARELARGALDVALAPIFEALGSRRYDVVDGVAIASDGPVFSVVLAHEKPLDQIKTILLDPASLTSVHLLRVLLAEFHGLQPHYLDSRTGATKADARLLIGNQAITFRRESAATHRLLDLGEEWRRCTGLPFVYAAWLMPPDLPGAAEAAGELRALQQQGLAGIDEIVRTDPSWDADFRQRYLTQHIRFGLGDAEKAGIEKFRQLLVKHALLPADARPLRYI